MFEQMKQGKDLAINTSLTGPPQRAISHSQDGAAKRPSETDATLQPPEVTIDDCATIATRPDVLEHFSEELQHCGVVGETRLAKLLYLAITSRLLKEPVSIAVKGPSSGGKSYSVQKALAFFPPEAYHELTAMSEKALVYSKEPLQHRSLVLYEAAGIQGEFTEHVIRSLLSEGRVRYSTVEKTAGGQLVERLIEREGPTGLIVTTTLASMHPENETRYLSVTVADTAEQTRDILRSMAKERSTAPVDLERWQMFQRWLAATPTEVTIPFAEKLVELIPPVAVRLRRDFSKVLTLIRAHALVHRASRNRDDAGRVVAVVDDYRDVYELVADLIAAGVEATVPATVRETVEAVATLTKCHPHSEQSGVSSAEVAKLLGLDKSAAWRRVRVALQRGYLQNLQARKGRTAELVVGDPLPEEQTILPTPETLIAALEGCTVAQDPERPAHAMNGSCETPHNAVGPVER